jgi:hypothetical protein
VQPGYRGYHNNVGRALELAAMYEMELGLDATATVAAALD